MKREENNTGISFIIRPLSSCFNEITIVSVTASKIIGITWYMSCICLPLTWQNLFCLLLCYFGLLYPFQWNERQSAVNLLPNLCKEQQCLWLWMHIDQSTPASHLVNIDCPIKAQSYVINTEW